MSALSAKKCIIQQKLGKSATGEGQTTTQLSGKDTQLGNIACDTAVFRVIKQADSEIHCDIKDLNPTVNLKEKLD